MLRRCSLLAVVLALIPAGAARAQAPDAAQVASWIDQLGADDYFAREQATEALVTAGEPAVGALVEAAQGSDLELTARAVSILGRLANSTEATTSDTAEKALETLTGVKESLVSGRAKTALRARYEQRHEAAAATLRERGATLAFMPDGLYVTLASEQWRGTAEDLALLRWLPETAMLVLRGVTIGDEDFAFFSAESKLHTVSFNQVRISDAGLAHLERLPDLRTLQIVEGDITDTTLALFQRFKNLRVLYLVGGKVTDAGAAELAKVSGLTQLRLESLPITDEALKAILTLRRLEWLSLNKLNVAGAPLTDLGVFQRLRRLDVKYCPIDASVLKGLPNCPLVTWVTLYGTKISIEDADQFAAAHPAIQAFDHRGGGLLGVIGIPNVQGCQLQEVRPGMAAAKAGIEVRDIITHFDGQPIHDFDGLRALIRPKNAGDTAEIRWRHEGQEITKTVTLMADES